MLMHSLPRTCLLMQSMLDAKEIVSRVLGYHTNTAKVSRGCKYYPKGLGTSGSLVRQKKKILLSTYVLLSMYDVIVGWIADSKHWYTMFLLASLLSPPFFSLRGLKSESHPLANARSALWNVCHLPEQPIQRGEAQMKRQPSSWESRQRRLVIPAVHPLHLQLYETLKRW